MWTLLNLMCPVGCPAGRPEQPTGQEGIDIYRTTSVLGYCLLPIVLFSAAAVFVSMQCAAGCWAY